MKIWAYSKQTGKTELVDTCAKKDACYLVHEYQMAFGSGCVVWSGLKRDNPWICRRFDETAHYRCER
jgi:hypothetical protein